MPVLSNPKHEHFAQLVAGGKSATESYTLAGYSKSGAAQSAGRLLKVAEVGARVAELQKAMADRTIEGVAVSRQWVASNLKEIVERCMEHKVITDMFGNPIKVKGPDGEMALLCGFNAKAAISALHLLGQEEGMFVQRKEIGKPGDFEALSEEELDAELAAQEAIDKASGAARAAGTKIKVK